MTQFSQRIILLSLLFLACTTSFASALTLNNIDQNQMNNLVQMYNALAVNTPQGLSPVSTTPAGSTQNQIQASTSRTKSKTEISTLNQPSSIEEMFRYKRNSKKITQKISSTRVDIYSNLKNSNETALDLTAFEPAQNNNELITPNALTNLTINNNNIVYQFGYDLFKQNNTGSFVITDIPVGPDYVLGPGDTLTVYMWGKIEKRLDLTIDRNGKIVLENIGEVYLWQKKFSEAQQLIKAAMSKQYVNFDISITMGKLRSIKVFVLGDIENPGSYDLSSVATAFQALYISGGPKKTGSLRKIRLIRGKRTIANIDLYRYLLYGDNSQDPALKDNDTIFVEPIGDVVKIDGMVNRPAIYEISKNSNLYDIIQLAGGLIPAAYSKRILIDRIENNEFRAVLNISLPNISQFKTAHPNFKIMNGDAISIDPINTDQIKHVISIVGNINRPGEYELKDTMTLGQLIENAGGFMSDTYLNRIEIYRKSKEMIMIDYRQKTASQTKLKEFDIVKVYSNFDVKGDQYVYIDGAVKSPGKYKLYKNMTVNDLIFLGKPDIYANLANVEIYRAVPNSLPKVITANCSASQNETSHVLLSEEDRIFLRYTTEGKDLKKIYLTGEVKYPGLYLARKDEKLSSILERAGGFREKAFLKGTIFTRESVKITAKEGQEKILEREQKRIVYDQSLPSNKSLTLSFLSQKISENKGRVVLNVSQQLKNTIDDIDLEDNDSVYIPPTPATVQVIGGVQYPTSFIFSSDKSADYYISQAGGFTEFAEQNNIYILKANGSISRQLSTIEVGDSIYIPEQIKERIDWFDMIAKTASMLGNLGIALASAKTLGIIK